MIAHARADRCDLYQIGEVSRMGCISQRTLRHYDELGLMRPDVVRDNGYRYYSLNTMLKIPVINYLKMLGFSLDEITHMLQRSSLTEVRRNLAEHLSSCDEEARLIAEKRQAIVEWAELVDEANMVLRVKPKTVSVRYLASRELLCMESTFSGSFADSVVSLDYAAFVREADNAICGPVILQFETVEDAKAAAGGHACPVRLLQKAMRPVAEDEAYVMPEGMYLSTYHVGAFEEMDEALDRLLAFAHENGYKICGPVTERFVTDFWTTYNSELFVTELLLRTETE